MAERGVAKTFLIWLIAGLTLVGAAVFGFFYMVATIPDRSDPGDIYDSATTGSKLAVNNVVLDEPGDQVTYRVRVTVSADIEAFKARPGSSVSIAFDQTPVVGDVPNPDFSGVLLDVLIVDETTGAELVTSYARLDLSDCVGGCVRVYLVTFVWSDDERHERGLPLGTALEVKIGARATYPLLESVDYYSLVNPEEILIEVELVSV